MMSRNFKCVVTFMALVFFLGTAFAATPSSPPAPPPAAAPSTEMALFEEIPMVYSPAKKAQPMSESPASIYVLNDEDIKMYGGLNTYDSLRQLPGVNVMQSTVAQPDVSIRGLNDNLTNRTQLLLDGRNLYLPAQGFFMWPTVTVQQDEIKQIEVVKGPVASLYGANAFNGLINVITKSPEELNGTYFTEKTNFDDVYTMSSFVSGRKIGKNGYKVSAGWDRYEMFYREDRGDNYSVNLGKVNALTEYEICDDSKISFSGGGVIGKFPFQGSSKQVFLGNNDISYLYSMADCKLGNFDAKVFWNHLLADYSTPAATYKPKIDTIESELKYSFNVLDKHDITVGTGLRYDYAKANLWGDEVSARSQLIYDAYIQDDFKVFDRFRIVGSGRLDYYTITGMNLTGRIAGLFTIFEDNILRASIGNAFRAPSLSEYYLDIRQATTPLSHAVGQPNLSQETIVTGEVGYEGKFVEKRLTVRSDIFVSYIKDPIAAQMTGFESFFPTVIVASSYMNQGNITTWGTENSVEYMFTDWMKGFANWTHQLANYNENTFIQYTPKNMWNLGCLASYKKVEASVYWNWVAGGEVTGDTQNPIDRHQMLNARLGYKFTKNFEMAVTGSNLFLDKHVESPGWGEQIGRRIMAEVRLKY